MLFGEVELPELSRGFVKSCVGSWLILLVSISLAQKVVEVVLKIEPRPFLWLRMTLPMLADC